MYLPGTGQSRAGRHDVETASVDALSNWLEAGDKYGRKKKSAEREAARDGGDKKEGESEGRQED